MRLRAWLHARWLSWRNARLADPVFQRRAAAWWPTRGIARRDTRRLFDLCAGFVYSQVLMACVELDLFETLADKPMDVASLARRLGLSTAATERLLAAATGLALLERLADGRYGLGSLGAATRGNPAVAAMVSHHHALYTDLADPVARLRDRHSPGALRRFWSYAETPEETADTDSPLSPERTQAYTRLMAESQAMIADQVRAACDLSQTRQLLDVGGGSGVFAEIMSRSYPGLIVTILDLPSVAAAARKRLAGVDPSGAIRCCGADMFYDEWPAGCDTVSLIRILHDHDDAPAARLLRRAYQALPEGGRLIVAEPMSAQTRQEPVSAAYFGFYLWAMGQGRPRSSAEIRSMCHVAGFSHSRVVSTPNPLLARVVVAYRTAATDGH